MHVESGILLSEILKTIVPKGWFLKITPGTKFITVGGAIASDVHGKNHHKEGCFSECVEEFDLMLPDGNIASCNKKDELFKATCGGMGLTGVIISAKISLIKINSKNIDQITIKTKNLKETFQAFEDYSSYPYSVAWIDCLAKGKETGRCLLKVGNFSNDGDLSYKQKKKINIPFIFPLFLLNTLSVKIFNWIYYHKSYKNKSNQKVDIDEFFYPLDNLNNWNRIYGKKGFTQYQFILPKKDSYDGLFEILSAISNSGKSSFLSVLKLYGKENKNYLSFPMEGYLNVLMQYEARQIHSHPPMAFAKASPFGLRPRYSSKSSISARLPPLPRTSFLYLRPSSPFIGSLANRDWYKSLEYTDAL